MLVGYARVSTLDQETHLQRDALGRAGVRRIFEEKISAVSGRPQLRAAIASMQPGDVLVVWKLDRIARSLTDLLEVLRLLREAGCAFRSLTEPVDTSTPIGEFILQVLGAVAQLERQMIRERCVAGQVAAYARGVRWGGRKHVLNEDDREAVRVLYSTGWYTQETIALMFDVSRSTIHRIVIPQKPSTYVPLPVLSRYLPMHA